MEKSKFLLIGPFRRGVRRRETGDRRRETGDGRRETGDGRRETDIDSCIIAVTKILTGDGRLETGDGRREKLQGYGGNLQDTLHPKCIYNKTK